MTTIFAITVIVLASCYSLYHLYQAIQGFRAGAWDHSHSSPFDKENTSNSNSSEVRIATDPVPLSVVPPIDETDSAIAVPAEVESASQTPSQLQQSAMASGSSSVETGSQTLFTSASGAQKPAPINLGNDERIRPEDLPIPEEDLVFGPATSAMAQLLPETAQRRESQQKSLVAAGYHSRAAWTNLAAIRFALAFVSLVIVGFWLLIAPPQLEIFLLGLALVAPLMMWALPPLFVNSKANDRRGDIERGLPDVLDMLNMGVSQGLTVPASLTRIAPEIRDVHPSLSKELSIVNQQAQVSSMTDALQGFSSRVESQEVSAFTSLLLQSQSTGTSISHALTEYSDSMRNSLKERADSKANAASFKLLFPTALCLMPSVFLFLLGPPIVEMSDFFENTASSILNTRSDALQSLDQQPVVMPLDN